MKFWIRVVVAVAVILVAVFAVWAFFFREKEEVQAYNKTAELIDYKESIGFKEKLVDLRLMNYYNDDKSKPIGDTSSSEQSIQNMRTLLLSLENIESGLLLTHNWTILSQNYCHIQLATNLKVVH